MAKKNPPDVYQNSVMPLKDQLEQERSDRERVHKLYTDEFNARMAIKDELRVAKAKIAELTELMELARLSLEDTRVREASAAGYREAIKDLVGAKDRVGDALFKMFSMVGSLFPKK